MSSERLPSMNKKINLRTYNRIINLSKTYLKKLYYADKFHKNKNNIKLTWRLINEVLGNNPNKNISTKFNINDKCITDQQEIANHFNSFFSSIGTTISQQIQNHDQIDHRRYLINRPVTTFHFHEIITQDVTCIISKLPNKKKYRTRLNFYRNYQNTVCCNISNTIHNYK